MVMNEQGLMDLKKKIAEKKTEVELHPFNAKVVNEQKRKLSEIKEFRDGNEVKASLFDLKKAAQMNENVMPHILRAVRSYATLGEMTRVFKEAFGEFKEPIGL